VCVCGGGGGVAGAPLQMCRDSSPCDSSGLYCKTAAVTSSTAVQPVAGVVAASPRDGFANPSSWQHCQDHHHCSRIHRVGVRCIRLQEWCS